MRRRIAPVILLSASIALVSPRPCAAQDGALTADVESGAAWLRESGIPGSAVGTAGASLQAAGRWAGAAGSALGACDAGNRCTIQGVVTGALYAPAERHARWEVAMTGSGFALAGELPVSNLALGVREYLGTRAGGVYAGAAGGVVREGITRAMTALELGGWWQLRSEQLSVGGRFSRAPAAAMPNGSAAPLSAVTSLGDLWGGWRHDGARLTLSASAGLRLAPKGSGASGGWASLGATQWLTRRVGITLGAGRAIEDPTRGIPAVRYASLSLRVRLHAPEPPLVPPSPPREGASVTIAAAGDSTRLEVRVARATAVEVAADFTDWEPVPLTRSGDCWKLVRQLASGPHHVAVRVDGGEWRAPANLPQVHDEFGGTVGLLTVP